MIEFGLSSITASIFGLQVLLIPFQIIHYFSRSLDKSRLRFLLLSLLLALFNGLWLLHITFFESQFVLLKASEVYIGLALATYVYFYISKELNLQIGKFTPQRMLLALFLIEAFREITEILVVNSLSVSPNFFFSCLFQIVSLFYAIHALKTIFNKRDTQKDPMSIAAIGILIIALILPMLLFFVRFNFIENFLINLGFVFIVVAYFRIYFVQVAAENRGYQAGINFSHLNQNDRYLKFPHGLNDYDLTIREREVGLLILDGKTYQEIADITNVSEGTIRTHAMHIYKKTGVVGSKKMAQFRLKFANKSFPKN